MARAEGRLPPLHVVTDDEVCGRPGFLDAADAVLRAGGAELVFHLRMPAASGRRVHDAAAALVELARPAIARVVVNDRLDAALAAGAHGVHLGERSLPVEDARRLAPAGFLVGASVHAAEGALPEASWLLAGNVWATASHPGRPAAGTALVWRLAARGARVVAIGGVTPERVGEVREAGARGVAVVSGVWSAPDPAAAVERYLNAWYQR